MEKLMKMIGAMMALLMASPEERDQAAIDAEAKGFKTFIEGDEFKALAARDGKAKEMVGQIEQLKAEHDKTVEQMRMLQRAGLTLHGGQVLIPSGKTARVEMLKDNRAFLSDETALRFGCYMADSALKLHGRGDQVPKGVREIADDVRKSWAEARSKDLDPNVDASGGYLIPDEYRAELIRNVEAVGRFFPLCRRIPLATIGTTKLPKRTSGVTVYWTAPATQGTRSTPGLDMITLQPEKLMGLVAWPNEFQRTALLVTLGQWIGVELTYAIAYALDNALINGDGSAEYGGITGILQSANISAVAAAATHTTLATLDAADIDAVIAGITTDFAGGFDPRWGVSLSTLMTLRGMRNTNQLPVLERLSYGAQVPANLDGYPFTIGNRMPAAAAITAATKYGWFGDPRMSHVMGVLQDIQIATSDQVLFESDMTVTRVIMHADIQEQDVNAIVTAKTAAA